jgi:hypothetical protein
MSGCFGNDPYDQYLESLVNAHCDDSGVMTDKYYSDLVDFLSCKKPSKEIESDVYNKLKDGEAIVYEGKAGICMDGKIKFFKTIDLDEIMERLSK